jgi:hypothetical protein
MSEPRWTKGPWSEHGKGGCSCGQIFGPDGNAVICMVFGPGNVGSDGPDCFPNAAGQKANALLISAAPDLAEALSRILRLSPGPRIAGGGGTAAEISEWDAVYEAAETALAKAGGEAR